MTMLLRDSEAADALAVVFRAGWNARLKPRKNQPKIASMTPRQPILRRMMILQEQGMPVPETG